MAVWEIGSTGWTFDTDIFVDNALNGIGMVAAVALPVSSIGRAAGARLVRALPVLGRVNVAGGKIIEAGAKMGIGAWIGGIVSGGSAISSAVASMTPRIKDEVIVEVHGEPGSSKKQLYFLAMAAANGTVKKWGNFVSVLPAAGSIAIDYNAADNWVRCTIKYDFSCLQACGVTAEARSQFFKSTAVFGGPPCAVVGAKMGFIEDATAGIPLPGVPTNPDINNIIFADKTILTDCPTVKEGDITPGMGAGGTVIPTPNPVPPGDHRSRGSIPIAADGNDADGCCAKATGLISLVYTALATPGSYQQAVFNPPSHEKFGK